jgi:hypothetical protein
LKNLDYIISRIPVALFLGATLLSMIFIYFDMSDDTYQELYYYLNEVMNTSLVANVFMLLAVYRYKLCLYNKVSVYALLSMNAINIIFLNIDVDYEIYDLYMNIFTHFIMIPTAILAIILFIKKV